MKAKKTRKKGKKSSKLSFLRKSWDKLKHGGESLLGWLEWNTRLVGALGLIVAGWVLLCPAVSLEATLAWGAIVVGGYHLLMELKDRLL
jgi:hypothetical protein